MPPASYCNHRSRCLECGHRSIRNWVDELPNLPRSGGFEGMALSVDGTKLLPILEHALVGQQDVLNVYAFDLSTGRYLQLDPDSAEYRYLLDPSGVAAPEITVWSGDDYLVIERDGGQGPTAEFKRVFLHIAAGEEVVTAAESNERGY